MLLLAEVFLEVDQHPIQAIRVITTGKSLILSLLHLRRRHQLHRLGDLRGIFNRLDSSADVAKVGHSSGNRGLFLYQFAIV